LAFSADGKTLASASSSGIISLWEISTGRLRCQFSGPATRLAALTFSPDGRSLAYVAELDATIFIAEAYTGRTIRRWTCPAGTASLAFAHHGCLLASASEDTTVLLWDMTGPRKSLPCAPLDKQEFDALWPVLAGPDASSAYAALGRLVAGGASSVRLLRERVKPIARVDLARLDKLIRDLDHETFSVREQAKLELETISELAHGAIVAAIPKSKSVQTRRSLQQLLQRLDRWPLIPENTRTLRAVEALERIGDKAAVEFLRDLARGSPHAHLTAEATLALSRLTANAPPLKHRRSW
jgi:hypothetical protein